MQQPGELCSSNQTGDKLNLDKKGFALLSPTAYIELA